MNRNGKSLDKMLKIEQNLKKILSYVTYHLNFLKYFLHEVSGLPYSRNKSTAISYNALTETFLK